MFLSFTLVWIKYKLFLLTVSMSGLQEVRKVSKNGLKTGGTEFWLCMLHRISVCYLLKIVYQLVT